ncbi:MAG: hypothetical protein ABSF50_03270 [Burkholderiaceae bacterium]
MELLSTITEPSALALTCVNCCPSVLADPSGATPHLLTDPVVVESSRTTTARDTAATRSDGWAYSNSGSS